MAFGDPSTIDEESIGLCSDANGKYIIKNIHIMSINAQPNARMISHPIESGGQTMDNKVIEPIKLTLKAYIKWDQGDVLDQLYKMWRDRTTHFYSVVTRDGVYKNMAVISIPHNENPQKFDVFEFTIGLQEVMFAATKDSSSSDASNDDTVRAGRIGGSLGN